MKYGDVKNAHIVPATYLRNFADDGQIGVHLVRERRDLVRRVENVGTRTRFYRRRRPRDGTFINDIEWSLSELESAATPVLREFEDRWPLGDDDKSALAHLFAYQLLRGPRYKAEYDALARRVTEQFAHHDDGRPLSADELVELQEALAGNSHRFTRMLILGQTVTSVLVSTHWTLVEFREPVLATSDHPVVVWPGGSARTPEPTKLLEAGGLECIEYRVPLSPTRGVLMTWSDAPDDEETRVDGSHAHAMNFNAFTIASADRQWFYYPGAWPPRAAGRIPPLSPELVRGYTAEAATTSARRAAARAYAQEKINRDISDREVVRVKVSRRT